MPAAIYATQRDRPGRAGHDAVAAGGVPAGRVHAEHPGALPAQLRPDDGVGDRDLAARQLHADADAGVALAAAQSAAPRRAAQEHPRADLVDAFYRPIERAYMAMLALRASTTAGWWCWRRSRTLVSMRAAGPEGAQGLLAQERRGAVRDRACARRKAPAWPPRRSPPSASRARSAHWPEVSTTVRHHRRQPAEDAEPGLDLRAPGAARPARAVAGPAAGQGAPGDRPQAAEGVPHQRARRWPPSARARSAPPPCSTS